jgi:hypothetical protein
MKNTLSSACACMALLFTVGCATQKAKDPAAPAGPPSATITFHGGRASYYGSAAGGSGTINFHGKRRNFDVASVGAGGTGLQSVEGTGKVYNLDSLAKFPGTYTGARSGLTLLNGTMHAKLTNKNGTVIYIVGKTTGLASSTGVDTVTISLR